MCLLLEILWYLSAFHVFICTPSSFYYISISESYDDVLSVLTYNGVLLLVQPRTLSVACTKGQDTYNCPIKYGSWTYDGFKLTLHPYEPLFEQSFFVEHPRWRILEHSADINVNYYDCCPEPYTSFAINLSITESWICPAPILCLKQFDI